MHVLATSSSSRSMRLAPNRFAVASGPEGSDVAGPGSDLHALAISGFSVLSDVRSRTPVANGHPDD